jgi:hypothetical protein
VRDPVLLGKSIKDALVVLDQLGETGLEVLIFAPSIDVLIDEHPA